MKIRVEFEELSAKVSVVEVHRKCEKPLDLIDAFHDVAEASGGLHMHRIRVIEMLDAIQAIGSYDYIVEKMLEICHGNDPDDQVETESNQFGIFVSHKELRDFANCLLAKLDSAKSAD